MTYSLDDIQVYIPTYNRPELLRESIKSLVSQSIGVPKITVINNGTLQETTDVINEFKDYGIIEYKSSGELFASMDKVAELVQSPYVMIFHDDDILNSEYLKYAIKALNTYDNIAFITTRTKDFTNQDDVDLSPASDEFYLFDSKKDFSQFMYLNELIAMQTAIYNVELFKKHSRDFDLYGKFCDWPYLVKLSGFGKVILFNDKKMFNVRIHPAQYTNDSASGLSLEQLINWHKQFYDSMEVSDENLLSNYIFYSKFHILFEGAYNNLISAKAKSEISLEDAIEKAGNIIGFDSKDLIYNKSILIVPIQKYLECKNYYKNFQRLAKDNSEKSPDFVKFVLVKTIEYINDVYINKKDTHKTINILGIKFKVKKSFLSKIKHLLER